MDFKYFILSSSKFLLDIPGIGDSPAGYISVTIAKSANFRESLKELKYSLDQIGHLQIQY